MFILMIGPLPPPIGGATVLFEQLVKSLSDDGDVDIFVVNTGGARSPFRLVRILFKILMSLNKVDVVTFHASLRGALYFMPFLSLACSLFGRPIVFRGFGGDYPDFYKRLGRFNKSIFKKYTLSSDIVFFETKESVDYFSEFSRGKVMWYPNSRPISMRKIASSSFRKACFISQIKSDKGVCVLSDAINDSKMAGLEVDCFGPLLGDITEDFFEKSPLTYKGVLAPSQVKETLLDYDILIFPTYYSGEGYPGVILEAFSVGMPVITTDWRCIPEIVDDKCGVLIEPKNKSELLSAIENIFYDSDAYINLQNGAREKGDVFDSTRLAGQFSTLCKSILKN